MAHGRLVWDGASSVLLMAACSSRRRGPSPGMGGREKVYEARVETRSPEHMLLRLSEECCQDLRLRPDRELQVELQFQLNRMPLCEMHFALDSLQDCTLLFPEPPAVGVPLPLNSCSTEDLDARLNARQREAVRAIAAPFSLQLPPLLLCGPPGSGKTFTLSLAVGMLLRDDTHRVLLCAHTEEAADTLVNDLLTLTDPPLAQGSLLR
ncbi:probable helicase with zinc finger domain [Amia ocellicauda]|uniref:probable helicase with zinc finger domain n=1 Tax=Amia ocellicauda TaxID=2972642 RepID=UPI003463F95C